ncbi:hypothetical protein A5725_13165 [Mycobacterium kubicae]|nr:hypothetical protein A5725_13165 [Mycobacterium kubicae]
MSRGVYAGVVVGGEKVEKQTTHDCQAKASSRGVSRSRLSEPCLYGSWQHPRERLLALETAGIALEEQALERAQFGTAEISPHGSDRRGGLGWKFAKQGLLPTLDLIDDRQQKLVPGPEVMQEHAVADAHRGRHVTQGPVADAAFGVFLDHRVE